MAGISDLKNDGNNERVIPHVEEETIDLLGEAPNTQPVLGNVPKRKGSVMMSMSSGREERVKADLSSLPKPEPKGVDIKESIEAEIFKPGGDFDKYLANKKKEYLEDMAKLDEEREIEGVDVEETVDITGSPIDDEPVTANTVVTKHIDIFGDDEDESIEEEEDEPMREEITAAGNHVNLEDDFEVEATIMSTEDRRRLNNDVEEPEEDAKAVHPLMMDEEETEVDITVEKTVIEDKGESIVEEDEIEAKVSENETDESFEILKKMVTEKLKPVSKKLDLSGFTVASKGTNTNVFKAKEVVASKWVLPFSGTTVLMKELLGADLEKLRMVMQANDARSTLQIIYDNIVSPKPAFDKWLNSVAGMDYEHLFMAVYVASFNGSNYMPIDCTNTACKEKSYITDDVPFKELVSYKDEAAKAKFMKLYKEEPVESQGLKAAEIIAISDDYAIGLCVPTLYGALIEPGYFADDFIRKHASVISMLPYIDKMYIIDKDNKQLIPIEYKDYPLDPGKTAKAKAVKYGKVFATLTSDEITTLRACIRSIGEDQDIISYKQPSTKCPHCGHQNPEVENVNPSSLVFLRNQLGLLTNM